MRLSDVHKLFMKDPKYRKEWHTPDHLGLEYSVLRKMRGLSQKEVAETVATEQSSISRFENGNTLVSLSFLTKLANAIGYGIEIKFVDLKGEV